MEIGPAVFKQLLASFLSTTTAIAAKLIYSIPVSEFIYLRSMTGVLLGYLVIFFLKVKIYDYNRKTLHCLLTRGVVGSLGSFSFFYGLQYISLSEAFMINRLAPLWTSLISIYILKKEQMDRRLLICLSLSLCGLYLIMSPEKTDQKQSRSNNYIFGLIIVLLASVSHGAVNALVTTLGKEVDSVVIQQYQSFFSMLPGIFYPFFFCGKSFGVPSQLEVLMILVISIGSICQGILNFQSLREGKLSIISNVSQTKQFLLFQSIYYCLSIPQLQLARQQEIALCWFLSSLLLIQKIEKQQSFYY